MKEAYNFTPSEIREMQQRLTGLVLEYRTVEDQKKINSKELTQTLKELRSDMEKTAVKLRDGYEMREVQLQGSLPLDDEPPAGKRSRAQ